MFGRLAEQVQGLVVVVQGAVIVPLRAVEVAAVVLVDDLAHFLVAFVDLGASLVIGVLFGVRQVIQGGRKAIQPTG